MFFDRILKHKTLNMKKIFAGCILVLFFTGNLLQAQQQYNILWLTVEDMSPHLNILTYWPN